MSLNLVDLTSIPKQPFGVAGLRGVLCLRYFYLLKWDKVITSSPRIGGVYRSKAEAGPEFSFVPDTANGKCSLLLAAALTMESLPPFPKVVEQRVTLINF